MLAVLKNEHQIRLRLLAFLWLPKLSVMQGLTGGHSETLEGDKEKYYDPQPLKYYRPPLKSDSRCLLEKVSQLSLSTGPRSQNFNNGKPTGFKPSQNNASSNTCSGIDFSGRGNPFKAGLQQQFKKTSSSSVCSDLPKRLASFAFDSTKKGHPTPDVAVTPADVNIAASCSENGVREALHRFPTSIEISSRGRLHQKVFASNPKHSEEIQRKPRGSAVATSSSFRRSGNNFKSSQNWRLGASGCTSQDSDSGVDSSIEPSSPRCSTPLPLQFTPLKEKEETGPLISRKVTEYNKLDLSLISSQSSNSLSCDDPQLEVDISLDQSFASTPLDDEVFGQSPDNLVTEAIPLLPVPENLYQFSPLHKKQSSSQASSSVSFASSYHTNEELSFNINQQDSAHIAREPEEQLTSVTSVVNDSKREVKYSKESNAVKSLDDFHDLCSYSPDSGVGLCNSDKSFSSGEQDQSITSCLGNSVPSGRRTNSSTNWRSSPKTACTDVGVSSFCGGLNGPFKRKSFDFLRRNSDVTEAVQLCFSKKFVFQSSDWKLPTHTCLFSANPWELSDFLELKQNLNSVKDELNDFPLQEWHTHTRRRNKAGNIMRQLRKDIDPEFATQAWCKFYENASSFPLIPQKALSKESLNSVHLCEAPGAFITSLNHFLHVNYGSNFKFDWRAVTLNPYYEGNPLSCMINDDRLILKTLDKWLFGEDNTGDLMKRENLLSIMKESSELGEVLLVTADGSFDCQDNPAEQESSVSWLHYCESVAALQMLSAGGSFLIKMFTFFEHPTICLLYFLNCVFRSVSVNKPVTSKEGNSEVYVICLGYIGTSDIQPWLDVLMDVYGPEAPKKSMFSLECIPKTFLDQLLKCADFFCNLQIDVIRENIRSFKHGSQRDLHFINSIRSRVVEKFFMKYRMKVLQKSLYLVDEQDLKKATTPNIDPRLEEGSFNDRRKRLALSHTEELKCIKDSLLNLSVMWPGDFDVFWMDFPHNPQGFRIVQGKPITKVNSSKFCLGSLLKLRNRVREIAQDRLPVTLMPKKRESDMREFPWPGVVMRIVPLDFKNQLWASLEDGSNADHEKNACREILAVVESLFRDDCLVLRGYPLLTQFNVGLVFLLGHLFEKVGFVRPQGQDIRVLFFHYKNYNLEVSNHLNEVASFMEDESKAVLSLVQISELADGDFYKYVTKINNLCVVEQIQDLLNVMSADL